MGAEPANCHLGERHTNTPDACVALPGNPLGIDERSRVIEGLSLQDLIDTGVVDCENSATDGELFDCENSATDGELFQFYSFRSEAPGSGDEVIFVYVAAID